MELLANLQLGEVTWQRYQTFTQGRSFNGTPLINEDQMWVAVRLIAEAVREETPDIASQFLEEMLTPAINHLLFRLNHEP